MTSTAETRSLVIGNTIAELLKVVEFVDRFGASHGVPQAVLNDLNLCLDELLNNTISYGYDDEQRHSIVVVLSVADGTLQAEIRDDARPFDPSRAASAAIGDSLQTRKIGGLGLPFIRALMDDLAYQRDGARNIVMITKKFEGNTNDGNR
jgi:serine/threonine-protein kinase RsbW/sigma-B regulation protein RsbU (phosphoserine phosphatase)